MISAQMPSADKRPARPLRILLVENHEDTLVCLRHHLEEGGHTVALARTADQALEELRREFPDVLLCDIGLPGRDGWELLGGLAGEKPRLCIAMSGYGLRSDLDRSRSVGFDHHLTKPFLPSHLDGLLAFGTDQG